MTETAVAPTNKPVAFRGDVAREPAADVAPAQAPAKSAVKRIRKKASRAIKRGMISEKAAKRHLKGA